MTRWGQLQRLGFDSYRDYLRSPLWAQTKARYRAADLPQACICGEERVQLHHKTYERVGREELTDLVPLCASCHTAVHVLAKRGEIGIDLEGLCSEERAAAYLAERPHRETPAEIIAAIHQSLERAIGIADSLGVDARRDVRLMNGWLDRIAANA